MSDLLSDLQVCPTWINFERESAARGELQQMQRSGVCEHDRRPGSSECHPEHQRHEGGWQAPSRQSSGHPWPSLDHPPKQYGSLQSPPWSERWSIIRRGAGCRSQGQMITIFLCGMRHIPSCYVKHGQELYLWALQCTNTRTNIGGNSHRWFHWCVNNDVYSWQHCQPQWRYVDCIAAKIDVCSSTRSVPFCWWKHIEGKLNVAESVTRFLSYSFQWNIHGSTWKAQDFVPGVNLSWLSFLIVPTDHIGIDMMQCRTWDTSAS